MKLALNIKNLTKLYNNKVLALANLSLSVEENSFLALLGKNGAGKTTFIGIISSLLKKNSGTISIFDKNMDTNLSYAKSLLGVVPQEFNFPIFESPMQILINQAGYFGISYNTAKERAIEYLEILDLWHKHQVPAMTLSGGMKRRLMLARALMHNPSILFLDEPTAGFDIEIRYKIWDFLTDLHKSGKTIVLTTHFLEEAEKLCTTLAVLDKGKILLHDDMPKILSQVNSYTLVLDIEENNNIPKEAVLRLHHTCRFINKYTVEIDINNTEMSMNTILHQLLDLGVTIKNIRNKHSSLESFFNKIITQNPN